MRSSLLVPSPLSIASQPPSASSNVISVCRACDRENTRGARADIITLFFSLFFPYCPAHPAARHWTARPALGLPFSPPCARTKRPRRPRATATPLHTSCAAPALDVQAARTRQRSGVFFPSEVHCLFSSFRCLLRFERQTCGLALYRGFSQCPQRDSRGLGCAVTFIRVFRTSSIFFFLRWDKDKSFFMPFRSLPVS